MSVNKLYFSIKKENEVDQNFEYISEPRFCLYANIDELSTWVADIKCYEDAVEKVKPENILNTLVSALSEYELDAVLAVLTIHPEYELFDDVFIYKGVDVNGKSS